MKKYILIIALCSLSVTLSAQSHPGMNMEIDQFEAQKIKSEKEYYADLPTRITKVVVANDNSLTDLLFRDVVDSYWSISPIEFCTYREFEQIKKDTNYYFLMRVDMSRKPAKGSSMEYITYMKGNEEAGENMEGMPELISLPLFPEDGDNDRIFTYLPAYMNIIQNYLYKIAAGRIYPGRDGRVRIRSLENSRYNTILLSTHDMADSLTVKDSENLFQNRVHTVSQEVIDRALEAATEETLVSLMVAPSSEHRGAYCYKMLISSDTYELYYYNRHKISAKKGAGFLKADYKRISKLLTPKDKTPRR